MGKQDIKYDHRNYRDHDESNLSLIKKSIQRCGAGRSILLDKNGEIIAGNATYKTLQELRIPVKIIPTDGKTAFEKGVKLYKWLWNGLCRKGERKIEGKSRVHPTQKPVGLIVNILKDFSSDNEIIFDGFGGSGTTMIACEQLGRKARLMEIDPKYCDVIITRWESLTGKPARLLEA